MSGFPLRPTRAEFGPTPVNRHEVRDAARELDGPTIGDLLFWQISGMGVIVARALAWIELDASGVPSLYGHAEAWNPNGTLDGPALTDNGNGSYKLEYDATYDDKDGNAQTLLLTGATADVQSTDDYVAVAEVQSNGRDVEVRVRAGATRTLTDPNSKKVLVASW